MDCHQRHLSPAVRQASGSTRPDVDDRDLATVIPAAVAEVGQPKLSDQWHGRMVTMDADFARFTEVDLDEATSRLTRLAACYQARLGRLDAQVLDARPDDATWTIREVTHHVGHVTSGR
jgi:hypothetical protein